jgi:flagellar biosynthesis anti-sigma factor FlgM
LWKRAVDDYHQVEEGAAMSGIRRTSGSGRVSGAVYDLAQARARAAAAQPAERADNVGLSEEARALGRAREAVEEAPEVRAARVRALKEKIARGEYTTDPEELARELLSRGF